LAISSSTTRSTFMRLRCRRMVMPSWATVRLFSPTMVARSRTQMVDARFSAVPRKRQTRLFGEPNSE
jgi:hypothetical protein